MARLRLAAFAFACVSLAGTGAATAGAATLGVAAPAIRVTLLDGSPFDSAAHRGDVVVVNFWATWCAPCRAEMPALDAYYRAHRDQGLVLVALSMDEPANVAKVKAAAGGFAFPVALAEGTRLPGYGRIWHLPMTIVIDRDGVLRDDDWSADDGLDAAALERVLGPLLRAPAHGPRPAAPH